MRQTVEIEKNLVQLVSEAKAFYRSCQNLELVLYLVYQRKTVNGVYKEYPIEDYHIPMMHWAMWQNSKRKVVMDWAVVSQQLDKANASLDERLQHMQIHMRMLQFTALAKNLQVELRQAYILQNHLLYMLDMEHFSINDFKRMTYFSN
ncbi:hypothetical protein [Stenoxybacter acetivorans]|uniref:hypothetical protein n=1 Tax=Stenoxybacter acetivorans TaxID=422441 RepID=UPI00055E9511|nr:hypothetical protein [Stenoxybacter acetivorans]